MAEYPEVDLRTIRQTNARIRALVERETLDDPFWVGGMVKNCHLSDMGHVYFDLHDDDHSIYCMIRQAARGTLAVPISNGMEIEVLGAIRVYEKRASVQIEVEKVRLVERQPFVIAPDVQEKLQAQGLFPRSKHPLPETIRKIGLITSKHSDALHDFETTYRERQGTASVKLVDVLLQGERAAVPIANAVQRLSADATVDVIVIIRGGGRTADLAVFNQYVIAEAICRCAKPVITGIGHQRDETFADLVADFSAITPTAAAVHLTPGRGAEFPAVPPTPTARNTPVWMVTTIAAIAVIVLLLLLLVSKSQ